MTKYDKALKAIGEIFNDTSVPQSETREDLEGLKEEIETYLDILED